MYNLAAGVTLLLPVDLLHVPGNGLHRGYRYPPESEVFRLLLTRIDLHHGYSLVSANGRIGGRLTSMSRFQVSWKTRNKK